MAEVTSYIDRLVAELCPEGVEFYPIEELFITRNGYTPSKSNSSYWENGTVPWFRMEDIRENGGILSESLQSVHESALKKGGMFPAGSIIVATSATIGEHALINVDFLCNQRFTVLILKDEFKNLLSPKFLYYYSFVLDRWCLANTTQSSFASVDMKRFKKFEFPVPPMEIQEAIVEILDKFTNLEAELEAELEARTLQYEYYRNSLFGSLKDPANGLPVIANLVKELCPDGVKYSTLKSVSLKTTNIKWERSEEAEYRYIDLSSVPTGGSSIGDTEIINSENAPSRARQIVHTDDILFGTTRPLLDRVVIVPEEYDRQICSTGYAVIRPDTNVVIPSYIYHILREKNFSAYVEKNQTGAAYPAISFKSVMEYMISLPPLEIQQHIVDILDRFDALTSSLSEGLPAELAARRSQYEYYRDQLLTFPRKGDNQ